MKITAEPRSDQWNADDFIGGPRTFTIASVTVGKAEQKYDIELVEGEGRSWRPPLTMLRLLIAAWGDEAAEWVGRKVTLYRDPSVRFGSDAVGGIRVSHMTDLPDGKAFRVPLTSQRGRRSLVSVEPMTVELELAGLRAAWQSANEADRPAIEARVAALQTSPAASSPGEAEPADTTEPALNFGQEAGA